MKLVVFGLSVSSSWGNGHANLWRGLIRSLAERGHRVTFFERNTALHAAHRDLRGLPDGELKLYSDWAAVCEQARLALSEADVGVVTSSCPDGVAATELVCASSVAVKAFYDLDAPHTLHRIEAGDSVPYLGASGLRDFDVVLSSVGGPALEKLASLLGAKHVVPLYRSVDPTRHAPAVPLARYRADLSYLGTYATERHPMLTELFVRPAQVMPRRTFAIGGLRYPTDFAVERNVTYLQHVPPSDHAAFYCSARLNLNVTHAPLAALGFCPSERLFEAAACEAPLITDVWPGLEQFYSPGDELIGAQGAKDVIEALACSDWELRAVAKRARARTLDEHTVDHRAQQLIQILEATPHRQPYDLDRQPHARVGT